MTQKAEAETNDTKRQRHKDKQTETHSQASRTERFLGVVSKQNIDKEISRERQSSTEILAEGKSISRKINVIHFESMLFLFTTARHLFSQILSEAEPGLLPHMNTYL